MKRSSTGLLATVVACCLLVLIAVVNVGLVLMQGYATRGQVVYFVVGG